MKQRVRVRFKHGTTVVCPSLSAASVTIRFYYPKPQLWALMFGDDIRWYATYAQQIVAEVTAEKEAV